MKMDEHERIWTGTMTERERLIAFMQERQLDHKALGRVMKWSPTFIYGYLGMAWSLSSAFKWAFAETFGFDVAERIFDNGKTQTNITVESPNH
jgi:hypothetical protein